MPETPAPEGRRVHFSPTAITPGDARPLTQQSRPLRHHLGHQSAQADDPFVGHRGNVTAENYTPVFTHLFIIIIIFLKFILGEL
jgi:hypothetical protein